MINTKTTYVGNVQVPWGPWWSCRKGTYSANKTCKKYHIFIAAIVEVFAVVSGFWLGNFPLMFVKFDFVAPDSTDPDPAWPPNTSNTPSTIWS